MPEMTLLGWVHTAIAILALISGFYTLVVNKVLTLQSMSSQLYLGCTFLAATTALFIYNQGGFGPGHMLAVLTLLALLVGFVAHKIPVVSKVADYFQALCFSSTLLFHMIPAITDGLLRLPVGAPVLTSAHDPVLRNFYLLFVAIFLIGYSAQVIWIKNNISANS